MTRLLTLVKEFSAAAEYEVRILKATTFLYTNNETARKKESNTVKIFRRKVTETVKVIYKKNYKTLMNKVIEDTHKMEDMLTDQKSQHYPK